jgi:hypothetical protein
MREVSMKDATGTSSRASPSRAASVSALISVVVALVGIAGQIVDNGSVAFPMLGAFGLAMLAVIVLMHERG